MCDYSQSFSIIIAILCVLWLLCIRATVVCENVDVRFPFAAQLFSLNTHIDMYAIRASNSQF